MADDTNPPSTAAPAASSGATYLRLVPQGVAEPVAIAHPASGAAPASAGRRSADEEACTYIVELAAAGEGVALARLSISGRDRIHWAGRARDCITHATTGTRALKHLFDGQQVEIVADLRDDPRFATVPREGLFAWCRAIACVPVTGGGVAVGMLAVFLDAPRAPGPAELATLSRLAALAGISEAARSRRADVARRRAAERQVERAIARTAASERRSLSRRLHEDVANHLAGTAMMLQSLVNRVPANVAGDALLEIGRQLHAVLADSRAIACADRGYLIEAHGLAQALAMALRELAVPGALAVTVRADPQAGADLALTTSWCLMRIAETAVGLARAARGTSRVMVRLHRIAHGGVRLSVSANVPWIVARPEAEADRGWEAMRHHARRIGADVTARIDDGDAHRLVVVLRAAAGRARDPVG